MNVLHATWKWEKWVTMPLRTYATNEEFKYWGLKKCLFDTFVILVLLYEVEVWGNSIPKSTLKRV